MSDDYRVLAVSESFVGFIWFFRDLIFLPDGPVTSLLSVAFTTGGRFPLTGTSGVLQALRPVPEEGKKNSIHLSSPLSSPTPRSRCCFYQRRVEWLVFKSHAYT